MIKDLLKLITIVTLIITIIGVAIAYHFSRISDLRSDYGERIDAIEREKDDAINERDLYFNYLVDMPDSVAHLQKIIDEQRLENDSLEQKLSLLPDDKEESYYASAYIKKGSTNIDDETRVVTGLLDVYRESDDISRAKIKVSLPTGEEEEKEVVAGSSFYFESRGKEYWYVVTNVNWYSDSIDISISDETTDVTNKRIMIYKNYLFPSQH